MPSSVVRFSLYVCACVCVSTTLRYCIKTAKRRITQIMPHDRPGTQMGCFVVAEFLLTSASRGPSAIAEFLVSLHVRKSSTTYTYVRTSSSTCARVTGRPRVRCLRGETTSRSVGQRFISISSVRLDRLATRAVPD